MPGETDEGQAPEGIICQLSKRVARDPVRTPYGHVSEASIYVLLDTFRGWLYTPPAKI